MPGRFAKILFVLLSSSLVGCSGSGFGGGGPFPSLNGGFKISGTLGGLSPFVSTSASSSRRSALALAAACADGKYYRVRCVSWTDADAPAQESDVQCNGASSGSFSVSGLTAGDEISCFVRQSIDGATYAPFATLEIPARNLSGTTDVLKSTSSIVLSVTVASDGTVTTTVTSGSSTTSAAVPGTTDRIDFNGFYNLDCTASSDASVKKACKCFLFAESTSPYSTGLGDPQESCMADPAATVDANIADSVRMSIDARLYAATVSAGGIDVDGDGTVDYAAGQPLQSISIWRADDAGNTCTVSTSCVTARPAGGEGAGTLDGQYSWDAGQTPDPGAPIGWRTGVTVLSDICGVNGDQNCTVDLSANPVPSSTATRLDWLWWIQALAEEADYYCYNGSAYDSSTNDDAFCLSNFAWRVLDAAGKNFVLPRVGIDVCNVAAACASPGVPGSDEKMVRVAGIEFDSLGAVIAATSPGADPRLRLAFAPWTTASAGGGGFKQNHDDRRWLGCLGASGPDSEAGVYGCGPGATSPLDDAHGVECFLRDELAIRFVPTAISGRWTVAFKKSTAVKVGKIRGGAANGQGTSGTFNATAKCLDVFGIGRGGEFFAKAIKF